MVTDKEIKRDFKLKASKDPDKFYATSVLKAEGFQRKKCKCGIFYWTTTDRETCDDPACSGGFRFLGKSIVKEEMDYIGVWNKFAKLFTKWGYTPIPRYPVVARWRDDTDFVQASIYDFQPYVVSGEVTPPANPLVIPQFCVRFNDIDNVGITGAHYTGFVMIGQHAFMPEEKWDQAKYFGDIHNWLKSGLGLPNDEITFHEDAWAGGGNFGPCMEFFSRGLELGNQVYMLFEQTPSGPKKLPIKVLDMGMGHERNAWFAKGTSTSYESVFPTVCERLKKITGLKVDTNLMEKFLPYSSYLNIDEVDDIEKTWNFVADKVGIEVKQLRESIMPLAALYSIGEHSRSLLFTIGDGALPSNVGGGYNLRVILRRALSFIEKYEWNIDLKELCEMHAKYLKPLFPELNENLESVNKILDVEKQKFLASRQKARATIAKIIKEDIDENKLLNLYDSHGIAPELIAEEAAKLGKKIKIPENFYARVAEKHEKSEQVHQTTKEQKLDLSGVQDTLLLFYEDWQKLKFSGKVLKIIDKQVVLDKTAFYPTGGGQVHDGGTLGGVTVVDVYKQGSLVVHSLEIEPSFKVGENISGEIDYPRRIQLAQHHTATHIMNAATKKVLGKHINQAGAKKTPEKATLDVTHYQRITEEELDAIEKEANKIVKKKVPVIKSFYSRDDAEKSFGMSIYQGGAVPGNKLRIVNIEGIDVECCGGIHLDNTSDVGIISVQKASKISDAIVRIIYTAGNAAVQANKKDSSMLEETAKILGLQKVNQIPARAQELFMKWKAANKANKKGKKLPNSAYTLTTKEESDGDILVQTAEIFKTQAEHVAKTAQRFLSELKEMKRKS